jgi:hypothetical protein
VPVVHEHRSQRNRARKIIMHNDPCATIQLMSA